MKKKDLIGKIRETALEEMPDVLHRIDISNIQIDDQPESIKSPFNLRRAFSYTFASLFILISGALAFNFILLGTDTTPLSNDTEIVGFQTISAASLLDSFELTELSYTESTSTVMLLSDTTTEPENDAILDQLNLVNNYLNMAETVLVNQEQYLYEEMESDQADYAYAFRYHGTDLLGNLIQYNGYYNIVDNGMNQTETGILIHEGKIYHYSTVTIENDGVTIYRYRIHVNEENYVEVSNSSTNKVQRFVYRVYRNDELMNQSEMTLVSNRNRLNAQVTITNRLNQEITLDIERDMTQLDQQQFRVNYLLTGASVQESGEFTVGLQFNEETGKYVYRYQISNKEVVIEERAQKGNQKATDDDFKPGRGNSNNPYVTTATSSNNPTTTTEQTSNSGSSGATTSGTQNTDNPGTQNTSPGTQNTDPGNQNTDSPGSQNRSQSSNKDPLITYDFEQASTL